MKKLLLTTYLICTASMLESQNCLYFDGNNDYVNINAVKDEMYEHRNSFTVEFWFKGDVNKQTSSIRTCMFAINEPMGENRLLIIMGGSAAQDGYLMIYPDGSWGSNSIYNSNSMIGDDQCHHLAYAYDGSFGYVYLDGALINTHAVSYNITPNDRYSIGQEYDLLTTTQFFNGTIDDFRLWGSVRTSQEILDEMNSELTGTEPDLIAYYRFDQGTAGGNNAGINVLADSSSNLLDGQLVDFALNGNESNWIAKTCDIEPQEPEEPGFCTSDTLLMLAKAKFPNLLKLQSTAGNDRYDFEVFAPGFNHCYSYTFSIFNRWGTKVFEVINDKSQPDTTCQNCFTGKSLTGSNLNPGVYFYTLSADHSLERSGFLSVFD